MRRRPADQRLRGPVYPKVEVNSHNVNNSVKVDDHSVRATGGTSIAGGGDAASLSASHATGGSSSAVGGNANATGGAGGSVSGSGNADVDAHSSATGGNASGQTAEQAVNIEGDEAQRRNPVNTAYSAPVAIGGGVCMYTPVSGGAQSIVFGLSGSVAKRDKECERRAAGLRPTSWLVLA